eukprot:TRINITY_DN2672_c0_g1_i16.p1 TRINITY_DN2672_c0_g1~~TRINITY_DN2672_c0_g1_i16.p1  ORF type:complete len:113 (-),score=25.30 TRINITY_DN2672_c0_g1_i16:17-355(-)
MGCPVPPHWLSAFHSTTLAPRVSCRTTPCSLNPHQVGMMCAITGMAILPKCRWGEPECYFLAHTCAYTKATDTVATGESDLSLIHISEPTRLLSISYAVFCLKKKKKKKKVN